MGTVGEREREREKGGLEIWRGWEDESLVCVPNCVRGSFTFLPFIPYGKGGKRVGAKRW